MAKIIVLGPGALGLIFAARLTFAGHDVRLGVRHAQRARELADGITVTTKGLPTHVVVPATIQPEPCDLLIVALKRQNLPAIVAPWAAHAQCLVTLQNGLPEELGYARIVHASVWFPASTRGPTHSEQTGPGGLHLAGPEPWLHQCVSWLKSVAPTKSHPDAESVLWSKLLVNACITGMGVVAGVKLGELLKIRRNRQLFLAIVHEGFQVALHEGVTPATVQGFAPRFFQSKRLVLRPLQHAALLILGRRIRHHESSSLQSLHKGEKTEVGDLNGAIDRLAKRHGLKAPANALIWQLAQQIERGELQPSVALLNRFTHPGQGL